MPWLLRFLSVLSVLWLAACSSIPLPGSNGRTPLTQNEKETRAALVRELDEWRGTPYRLGGESRQGIDCSAFVQRTFKDQFNVVLPRTTSQQMHVGTEVNRGEPLLVGDLLFFRIGYVGKHVGIYLGEGEFMHASTQEGVTVSALNDLYWKKTFWRIRRVIDLAPSGIARAQP